MPNRTSVNHDESLARGHDSPWTTWRCLNRLRTGYTCRKEQRKKWQYFDGHVTCVCGLATENTTDMLLCIFLARPCTLDDLSKINDTAKSCVERWFDDYDVVSFVYFLSYLFDVGFPTSWKTAIFIPLPKSGKVLSNPGYMHISLTSCLTNG